METKDTKETREQTTTVKDARETGKQSTTTKTADKTTKNGVYIVETPVKNYNGTVAGVQFAYGKAEVKSGWILNWFRENGYIIREK